MPANAGVIASEKLNLRPVPVSAVSMRDGFWKTRMDRNHEQGIPALLEHLENHGVVDNFMIVSGRKQVERRGPYFSDSDLYKWMEGAAWDLITYDDPGLRADLDRIIDEVAEAQGPDGYLNTFFQGELFGQRFRNLPVEHELYCAGHLFQAAVAHYRATGEDKLLNVACRYADYLVSEFGPGKRQETDGHPEIEMALVELYRATGKKQYLDLAGFFLSLLEPEDGPNLKGHAVRALYMLCAEVDYFAETGSATSKEIINRQWQDLVCSKMYVTGGVGSRHAGEAIGDRYELPNERAYAETCAAIANVMFDFRMLGVYGEARYADEMERALYNGVISGVSLDGNAYFYVNPLANYKPYQRQEWFGCTCCPTNMVRTLASIPGYMYSVSDEGVWVHLFDNSRVEYLLADGTPFTLEVRTDYPWDGNVEITVGLDAPREFTVFVRRPGWCADHSVNVTGGDTEPINADHTKAIPCPGYVAIRKVWNQGDKITLKMEMPATLIEPDPRLREDFGCVAVQRGPIVYCAESTDNPNVPIIDLEVASNGFEASFEPDLLGGVVAIKGSGRSTLDPNADRGALYRPAGSVPRPGLHPTPITLIPYYAWANRGESHMTVWMPYRATG